MTELNKNTHTTESSIKQPLFIGGVIQRFFTRKSSKRMVELYDEFINGDGMKRLMDFQQKAFYREKELERQRMIREKYDYYKYREDNNLPIEDKQKSDYEYVTFWVETRGSLNDV